MNFEETPNWRAFDKRSRPLLDDPFVTIQRRGIFSLNASARAAMGNPDAVALLVDVEKRLIGFRPVATSNPRAYALRKQNRSNTWIVAGQAFTRAYAIDTSTTTRYSAHLIGSDLVVDLKTIGSDATGVRLKRISGSSETSEPMVIPAASDPADSAAAKPVARCERCGHPL